jgi:hypothetical protein
MTHEAKGTVCGASVHVSGSGLQYYVHYGLAGTKRVSEQEYHRAMDKLEQWRTDKECHKDHEQAF